MKKHSLKCISDMITRNCQDKDLDELHNIACYIKKHYSNNPKGRELFKKIQEFYFDNNAGLKVQLNLGV